MKTRLFYSMILFSLIPSLSAQFVSDDCPCRRKTIVVKREVAVKKAEVKKVALPRYSIFHTNDIPYENLCKGKTRERQSFKVKIMPNPVNSYINVIYDSQNGQKVKIELLSCEGKLIKTLMNKVVYGEGMKASTFDINGQVKRGD
ncbi:MAG: hypothetical protein WCI71_08535, partial [Bacteroidota bacterium]